MSYSNPSKKNSVTAIILTLNEEIHIERCIKSIIDLVDKIIVIDSFSTDKTEKICKNFKKIKFYKRKFIHQANQMNWVIKNLKIKTKWIFRIDADEYLTKKSAKVFTKQLKNKQMANGIILTRKIKFLNKTINYGITSPHKTLRIWKNKKGRYPNIAMDEQVFVEGKILDSSLLLIDHNLKGIKLWFKKHVLYASREAYQYCKNSNKKSFKNDLSKNNKNYKFQIYYKIPILLRPLLLFIYSYFIKLGLLDGFRGLVFIFLQNFIYRLLVDLNIIKFRLALKSNLINEFNK